jgi:hypothetical protein
MAALCPAPGGIADPQPFSPAPHAREGRASCNDETPWRGDAGTPGIAGFAPRWGPSFEDHPLEGKRPQSAVLFLNTVRFWDLLIANNSLIALM